MITTIELYKEFQLKLNKLDSDDNIDVSPGEFVLIFNEQQMKWFNDNFRNIGNKNKEKVQKLIEPDFLLLPSNQSTYYTEFDLPENFFDYIRSYALCSNTNCKNVPVDIFEIKPENVTYYLRDEFNKPSIEYQETFRILANGKVQVYKLGFDVDKVYLTYYRYPVKVDMIGYTRLDQTLSTDINPELDEYYLHEIIDLCVLETQRQIENGEGFQLSKDRIIN